MKNCFEKIDIFANNPIIRKSIIKVLGYLLRNNDSKVIFYHDIHLSDKGLKGSGDFEYLNSKASANEIFFFPDYCE